VTPSTSISGSHGETLVAIPTRVAPGGLVKVSGSHFDETVGIYLAFCVLPKKGASPTPCGGGINKAGVGTASYWISSNPPPYGIGLAIGYKPGGRFTKTLRVSSMIGKFDCRIVKCAITVRADHTREGDRSYDMFIPITFQATTHIKKTA
jgi:hypothetical protein